jgi:uncharacterized membrane-anchored protein
VSTTWDLHLSPMLNKVPEVTMIFWTIKILSTTVGETGADYLAVHVGLGANLTMACMACLLVAALILQLRARRYVPWIYWLTVVLVSIVGTQITDLLTDKLDISLYVSTVAFACALAATFALWYAVERTLSIRTISPRGVSCSIGPPFSSPLRWARRPETWPRKRSGSVSSSA